MSAPKTSGIVLCGGRSSRMHRPKALLPWRGRSMLENAVSVLGEVVDEVIVVSAPDLALPPLGARVVHDREPGLGPLAGIREGLEAATSEFAFVTSSDAPFLTAEVVAQLLAYRKAVAAESEGFVEAICMQRLGSSKNRCKSLVCDSNSIIHWLLGSECYSGSLCMKSQLR